MTLQWTQNSAAPCKQHVITCGFSAGPQDNWLITQHINRVVKGNPLPQVRVMVEFQYNCDDPLCEITLGLYKYETSSILQLNLRRDTSQYQLETFLVRFQDAQQNRQNRTLEINFNTDQTGFYLAFRDGTTCIEITRVIVFYNVCPGGAGQFVIRPELIAPKIDRFKTNPITVPVNCIERASTENVVTAMLSCTQGGIWTIPSGRECHCFPGHLGGPGGQSCTGKNSSVLQKVLHYCPVSACLAGMYLSVLYQACRTCPMFSEGTETALQECPCLENYYRAPGEMDLACTREHFIPSHYIPMLQL